MHHKFLKIALGLLILTHFAQAQTSKDNDRLRDLYEGHPEADADGDGVLTAKEAKAFKKKQKKGATGNEGDQGNSQIYKTVGKYELKIFVDTPKDHKADAKLPAIVFFHGGGFRSGSEKQFEQHAKYLAERGMIAFRVRYRLITDKEVEIMDCVEDAISAMRWVRANAGKLGVDPDRIAAGGSSAGGYLSVATLLYEHINAKTDPPDVSPKPNALVLFNPGLGAPNTKDFADPQDKDGKGELTQYIKPNLPPMIHYFGSEDPFLAVAKKFQEAYTKAGNLSEIITYEGEGHSFVNKDKYIKLHLAETDKFLTGLGWLEKK